MSPNELGSHTEKTTPTRVKVGHKLISNVLANIIGQFSTLLIAFAVVPYVVHHVGTDLYGLLVMVVALGALGGSSLGFGTALAKFISEASSSQDHAHLTRLVQTAVTFCAAIGLLCCLIIIRENRAIASLLFHGSSISAPVVNVALYVIAACILMSLISDVLSGILIGLQRFDLYNRIRIASSIVKNIGAVLVLVFGFYIKALLGVYLLAVLITLIAYLHYAYKLMPGLSLYPKFAWTYLRKLAGFSIPVVVAGLGAIIVHRLDRVLVAYYLPLSAVTFYAIPYMLAERSGVAVSNITSAVFPLSSELSSARDERRLRELYLRSTKMVVLLATPVTITLLAFSAPILRWWVGKEYALKGSLTLELLALGFLVNVGGHVPYVIAQGLGSPWISAKYSLLNGGINLLFFVLLIPRFGIAGAAAGFFISELLVIPFLVRRVNLALGITWKSFISKSYLRPAGCGVASLIVLCELAGHIHSVSTLISFCVVGITVYVAVALAIGIDKQERDEMVTHFLRIVRFRHGVIGA